jgi:CheY-like chemotaxis protein
MAISANTEAANRNLDLARVLLVHGQLASRLALQTILAAGGYAVDVAATPSEAFAKLDEGQYELVLSGAEFGSTSGHDVLAYARVKEYRPATALVTSSEKLQLPRTGRARHRFSIHTENVATFLGEVAELIGLRASRRSRVLRHAI